jgi:hypothetical protein
MRKLIKKETYSGLEGELYKLTGKDVVIEPHFRYPEDGDINWNYEILINGESQYFTWGHLSRVKKSFNEFYSKISWSKVWKHEK